MRMFFGLVLSVWAVSMASGCQSAAPVKGDAPSQAPEASSPAESPEVSSPEAPAAPSDSLAVEAPWRPSTADEAGLCGMEVPALSVEGCEFSGPWKGELGRALSPEAAHDKLDAALEACAREENCGGVSTAFNNASPWVLLGKGSGSWTLETDSYGCTVFLRCPVHGVKSAQ